MTEEQIRQIIQETVSAVNNQHNCRLTERQLDMLDALTDIAGDMGEAGNIRNGAKAMRENHAWFVSFRRFGEKIGTTTILIILAAIISGLTAATWLGVKGLFGK